MLKKFVGAPQSKIVETLQLQSANPGTHYFLEVQQNKVKRYSVKKELKKFVHYVNSPVYSCVCGTKSSLFTSIIK